MRGLQDRDWEIKALDDGSYAIAVALLKVAEVLAELNENIRTDHPLQGETFDGITLALGDIASALKKDPP